MGEQPGEQVQSEEPRSLPGSRGASAQCLTDTALAEETQKRLHLREAQASSSRQTAVASSPVARVVDKKQGPPSLVELRSSGGAGECEGDCLGLFQLLPDGGEKARKSSGLTKGKQLSDDDSDSDDGEGGSQGPVYRQLHDGGNCHYYLYRAGDFWWVNDEVGVEDGRLRAKVVNKKDLVPPLNGWAYLAFGNWDSDPTMTCSREVSPACTEVRIEISGRAQEKLPQYAGRYLLMQGKHNRGRGVWQHASGANLYLRVIPSVFGYTSWTIGDTIDGSDGRIRSPSAGGHCPSDALVGVRNCQAGCMMIMVVG